MAWLVLGPVERKKKNITGGRERREEWRMERLKRNRAREGQEFGNRKREREKRYSVKRPVDFCEMEVEDQKAVITAQGRTGRTAVTSCVIW